MSFLDQLQKKRNQLKSVETTITSLNGYKYVETTDGLHRLNTKTYGYVIDTKPDKLPACILDEILYLGSQDAVNTENIENYKITHILSIGIQSPLVLDEFNVNNLFVPCLDLPETNLISIIKICCNFIENSINNGGRILVHCNAGVSRSASIVIAFLIVKKNLKFEEAFNLVKRKRACIQPNNGFIQQLKMLNKI